MHTLCINIGRHFLNFGAYSIIPKSLVIYVCALNNHRIYYIIFIIYLCSYYLFMHIILFALVAQLFLIFLCVAFLFCSSPNLFCAINRN